MRPGKGLVSEEVAAAIVRFVAGGAELANAEVEPSLLSLICRELNDARLAQGRREISLDLLAGSHATILSNFYERALADQPAAVRRVIEDELLTASASARTWPRSASSAASTAAGAAPGTLALLVNRRLLRIEERLDARRVELTHDVLCGVVKGSRDQRQEREAREATERLLAEQRERELAARRALVRARQVAAVCRCWPSVAIAAAVTRLRQRAQRAHRAEAVRPMQARASAEQLLGYLTDDFVRELESFGRLDVVAEFAKRQIDYFHACRKRSRARTRSATARWHSPITGARCARWETSTRVDAIPVRQSSCSRSCAAAGTPRRPPRGPWPPPAWRARRSWTTATTRSPCRWPSVHWPC